jgi:hypothetical protein
VPIRTKSVWLLGVSLRILFRLELSSCPTPLPILPRLSTKRPLSLGVIFLTLYIDLIGFSIIFRSDPICWSIILNSRAHRRARLDGGANGFTGARLWDRELRAVLFGGVISSVFSLLQFVLRRFGAP